jgi:cytochrome c
MPQGARSLGCTNCHAIDRKGVGPAWMDVSKRYSDGRTDQEIFDQLVKKVSLGGQGNWGDLPMVANDPTGRKHEQIVDLVKFILALSGPTPESKSAMEGKH